jgi:hypothetical protein
MLHLRIAVALGLLAGSSASSSNFPLVHPGRHAQYPGHYEGGGDMQRIPELIERDFRTPSSWNRDCEQCLEGTCKIHTPKFEQVYGHTPDRQEDGCFPYEQGKLEGTRPRKWLTPNGNYARAIKAFMKEKTLGYRRFIDKNHQRSSAMRPQRVINKDWEHKPVHLMAAHEIPGTSKTPNANRLITACYKKAKDTAHEQFPNNFPRPQRPNTMQLTRNLSNKVPIGLDNEPQCYEDPELPPTENSRHVRRSRTQQPPAFGARYSQGSARKRRQSHGSKPFGYTFGRSGSAKASNTRHYPGRRLMTGLDESLAQ